MPFHITVLYAGLVGIILVVPAVLAVRARRFWGSSTGTGGNGAEIVPVILILMGLLEAYRLPALLLHCLGIALTVSRLLHAWSTLQSSVPKAGRDFGNTLAWIVLTVASVVAIAIGLGIHTVTA